MVEKWACQLKCVSFGKNILGRETSPFYTRILWECKLSKKDGYYTIFFGSTHFAKSSSLTSRSCNAASLSVRFSLCASFAIFAAFS